MRFAFPNTVLVLVLAVSLPGGSTRGAPLAPNVIPEGPRTPAEENAEFQLPPGFEAQLVAAEPDIHKPLNIAFDDRGRLWVTDTLEYPFAAPGTRKPRDTVKILEDFGPDGRARKITTFADELNIPIGVLPLRDPRRQEALVYSIPNIYRLTDTTGKGVADRRELLFGTYGFKDTHGMTNAFTPGFDGWIYACHGFSNTSTVKGGDGKGITLTSGNTYRLRPDGSRLEQFTWGQVNPFGLAFDPLGYLYSADCHSQPVYQLMRGGYYPSFGKPHDGLGFAPEMFTGYKGSTAISGIVYYAADQFPASARGTLFIGDVMTNEIVQFSLTWTGSSPRAAPGPFLTSKDRWFRPVDLKLGPDGALYVADFYNRIIGHYEVPLDHPGRDRERGRIWRIVYTGKDATGTPSPRQDWTRATVPELTRDLAHPNLTVRLEAAQQLVERGGKKAIAAMVPLVSERKAVPHARAHAVWVLARLGGLDADLVTRALEDSEPVKVHTLRALAEQDDLPAPVHSLVQAALKDDSAHVRRAAADALGRHPSSANVRPLLDLRHTVPVGDTHLLHGVRMALRDQLRPPTVYETLRTEKFNEADARALADVSLGVPSEGAAHFLLEHLASYPYPPERQNQFAHHVARYATPADVVALLDFCKGQPKDSLMLQAGLFRALERGTAERGGKLTEPARQWGTDLAGQLLEAKAGDDLRLGIELTGQLKLVPLQTKVARVLSAEGVADPQRVAAMTALMNIDPGKNAAELGKVLVGGFAMPVREQAAGLLARANQPASREELVRALPTVPARLQTSIAAGLAGGKDGAELLLQAVAAGKASARLLQERAVAVPLENTGLPGVKERLAQLTAGLPPADVKLHELLNRRRDAFAHAKRDAGRGNVVFEKHCAACHQVGGKGARIGPQLDGIGTRGLERLLEDTLDPNRNVDQAFRLTSLTLSKGQIVQGLLLREEGAILVLADAQGKEVRVPTREVEERSVVQMSPMPANFADLIPEADFYDLMAFLLDQRAVKPK